MISLLEFDEIIQTMLEIAEYHHSQDHDELFEECTWYECSQTRKNVEKLRELKGLLFTGVTTEPLVSSQFLSAELEVIFRELAVKQEPLGKDFEKVLNDNYWDLLVTDAEPGLTPESQNLDSIGE